MISATPDNLDTTGYRDLEVWSKGMELASMIHSLLSSKAATDLLVQQLIAHALDVPTRIAEGYASGSSAHFLRMLSEAKSSLAAFDTQLTIARSAGYVPDSDFQTIKHLLVQLEIHLDQLTGCLRQKRHVPMFLFFDHKSVKTYANR